MPRLAEVCRYVRSKNAGPFWITIDLFFDDRQTYLRHRDDPAIGAASIARLYEIDEAQVRRFAIDRLHTVKISIPRRAPQGGVLERDMHGGQQFIPLLSLELGNGG
jgi:hypothetical protein